MSYQKAALRLAIFPLVLVCCHLPAFAQDPQAKPGSDGQAAQREARTEEGLQRLVGEGRHLRHHRRRAKGLQEAGRLMTSAKGSLKNFGGGAIRIRTRMKTNSKRNTTSASPTRMNTSLPAFRAGKPIAAASGSCMASLMSARLTRWAAATNVLPMKAAAPPRPILLRSGSIVIFPA